MTAPATAPGTDPDHALRVLEACLFAARAPLPEAELRRLMPPGADVPGLADRLDADYAGRGLVVSRTRAGYAIRTAPAASDLAAALASPAPRLGRAALETLACIAAYEEAGTPLTRREIERVRDVNLASGILDDLLDCGYVKPGRRRETRGRPLTWLTTEHFHDAFGLAALADLPAYAAMREAGLAQLTPLDAAAEDGEAGEPADGP